MEQTRRTFEGAAKTAAGVRDRAVGPPHLHHSVPALDQRARHPDVHETPAPAKDLVLAEHRDVPTATITLAFQRHCSRCVDRAPT
ncbi:hypothetical protein C3492_10735 [Streptomyces sp. Ru62]|uniref:hypothetical protein n=1 Tax=Streptomyces sp. Ru62 TaxID=2080745 RepID=UPI000CDDF4E1|nr:hypothetical protein [Streptomyces sp. Ru62]POX63606.1 hypothetical protein C3492_10735 [Streptomyces sp. Ru62]